MKKDEESVEKSDDDESVPIGKKAAATGRGRPKKTKVVPSKPVIGKLFHL